MIEPKIENFASHSVCILYSFFVERWLSGRGFCLRLKPRAFSVLPGNIDLFYVTENNALKYTT